MNRQELKFDAKEKMRQAAVNPYVVTIIMELPSAEENSVHTSFPLLYFLLFTY